MRRQVQRARSVLAVVAMVAAGLPGDVRAQDLAVVGGTVHALAGRVLESVGGELVAWDRRRIPPRLVHTHPAGERQQVDVEAGLNSASVSEQRVRAQGVGGGVRGGVRRWLHRLHLDLAAVPPAGLAPDVLSAA